MLLTKLNRPKLSSNLLERTYLIEKLEYAKQLAFVLVSAPAGFGKSVLISQWIEHSNCNYAWLSLDESTNDTPTFISYFTEMLKNSGVVDTSALHKLDQEYYLISWIVIVENIVNVLNEIKEPTRLILDDYHKIKNHEIHHLIEVLINEEINHLQLVIITRRDPPLDISKFRVYGKMLELRMQDLKFEEYELRNLISKEGNSEFDESEIKELNDKTEGWILAIRMVLLASLFPSSDSKNGRSEILTNDLDRLMSHISDNLDANFLRQMQICALCDQFNEELIDSICKFSKIDSCQADVFIERLNELNFFLIPTRDDGAWYRFHHLFGDILRRQLKTNDPKFISPLYLFLSSWFAEKGLIDESIQYAIKAEKPELACELIIKHRASVLALGHWWVVQRWLNHIPRQIRKTNIDLLLTELLICEETWNLEDFSSILDTLKFIGIENSSDENISRYLFHLGYFLTFVKPDPKNALASLERSKALCYDESYMFGGRRELIIACSKQMLGQTVLALELLESIQEKFEPSSNIHIRATHGKVLVHLLSGNFESASDDAKKLQFLVRDSDLLLAKGWSLYFQGNVAFHSYNEHEIMHTLKAALAFEGVFNLRAYFDALAGLILFSSLKGDKKTTELFLRQMNQLANKLRDTKFQNFYNSIKARINWHHGQGDEVLNWAQTDWVKQTPSSYLFLIDVPDLTKIRIMISCGSQVQLEESIAILEEVETKLKGLHNEYHRVDILLLKAMGFFKLGRKNLAMDALKKALTLAEDKDILRPVMEAYQVMPSLFNDGLINNFSGYRILSRIGLESWQTEKEPNQLASKKVLSIREEEIVHLIADGLQSKEIADKLNISILTVKTHLTNIYRKLEVPNRTSMIKQAKIRQII